MSGLISSRERDLQSKVVETSFNLPDSHKCRSVSLQVNVSKNTVKSAIMQQKNMNLAKLPHLFKVTWVTSDQKDIRMEKQHH